MMVTLTVLVVALSAGGPAAKEQPMSEPRFPAVTGSNLSGKAFKLPGDFEGTLNVVAIAFTRQQQNDIDTWLPVVTQLTRQDEGVRFYELPVLGRGYRLLSGFIEGGMRSGIPDLGARNRTITLYVDKDGFRGALALPSESSISVLVVDQLGRVLSRVDGPFTPEKAARLQDALTSARRAGSQPSIETGR